MVKKLWIRESLRGIMHVMVASGPVCVKHNGGGGDGDAQARDNS